MEGAIAKKLATDSTESSPVIDGYPCLKVLDNAGGFIVYDAKSHFAVFLHSSEYEAFKSCLGLSVADRPSTHALYERIGALQKRGVFLPGPLKELYTTDRETIRQFVDYYERNILLRKLTLEVTSECNFRCRYCPYTLADEGRKHEKKRMSREVAFRSIDFYFDRYLRQYGSLPPDKRAELIELAPPTLGWYGGEPFLNFSLIRDSLRYFLGKPWPADISAGKKFHFTLTTNFSAVTTEIMDFLASHRIFCIVSLDGPKEENDKYRLFPKGRGTFDVVYRNLVTLRDRHREYFDKYCLISAVRAENHDVGKCQQFFKQLIRSEGFNEASHRYKPSEAGYRGSVVPRAAEKVAILKSLLAEERDCSDKPYAGLSAEQLKERVTTDLDFADELKELRQFRKISYDRPRGTDRYGGMLTCPMGFDALLVATDGTFYMCEKTDQSRPLGNCWDGYDREAICAAYLEYNTQFDKPRCRGCWALRFCKTCAAFLHEKGKFFSQSDDECEYHRLSTELGFRRYLRKVTGNSHLLNLLDETVDRKDGYVDLKRIESQA